MPESSQNRTVLVRVLEGDIVVAVYGESSPLDEEWKEYLAVLEPLSDSYRMVIFSAGGSPSTMQRRDLEAVTRNHKSRVAVVTSSRTARGVVTAISWFDREIKAFAPSKHQEAFAYLELGPDDIDAVLRAVRDMGRTLGVLDTLMVGE